MLSFHSVSRIEFTEPRKLLDNGRYTNDILIHMEDLAEPVKINLYSNSKHSLRYHDNQMKTLKEIIRELASADLTSDSIF